MCLWRIALWLAIGVTSSPSTRPASLETVASLQKAYHDTVVKRDAAALRSLYIVRSAWERKMVDAYVDNDLAADELRRAVEKEYGVHLLGGGMYMPHDVGELQVSGNAATVAGLAARRPFPPLKKAEHGWRIDPWSWGIGWLKPPDAGDGALPEQECESMLRHHGLGMARVAAHVEEGLYPSVEVMRHAAGAGEVLADAKDAKPAPRKARPATRPVVVDLSTPLATYETFAKACVQGDMAAWWRTSEVPRGKASAEVLMFERLVLASTTFHVAAVNQFGVEGWKLDVGGEVFPNLHETAMGMLEDIDEAVIANRCTIKGDQAEVSEMSFGSGKLIRIGNEWKMREMPKEEEKEAKERTDETRILSIIIGIENEFAGRIAAGEFANVQAAQEAIQQALKDVDKRKIS
jgi:hypothetical protein